FIKLYKQKEKESLKPEETKTQEEEKVVAWKIRTFTRQLFSMAYLQEIQLANEAANEDNTADNANNEAAQKKLHCLKALVVSNGSEEAEVAVTIRKEGKTGVALSGGGFKN